MAESHHMHVEWRRTKELHVYEIWKLETRAWIKIVKKNLKHDIVVMEMWKTRARSKLKGLKDWQLETIERLQAWKA